MQNDPLIGQQLGAYTIQSKLGEGGMARVYKGYHARLRREVAVKVILSQIAGQEGFKARFEREAQLIAINSCSQTSVSPSSTTAVMNQRYSLGQEACSTMTHRLLTSIKSWVPPTTCHPNRSTANLSMPAPMSTPWALSSTRRWRER